MFQDDNGGTSVGRDGEKNNNLESKRWWMDELSKGRALRQTDSIQETMSKASGNCERFEGIMQSERYCLQEKERLYSEMVDTLGTL